MSAGGWIEQAINFVIFAILARLLGVETFSFLAMAAAFVLISEFIVRESVSEILPPVSARQPRPLRIVDVLLGACYKQGELIV
ncbi:hypothetical protein [Roseovarius pacificus]|uniref:hypothetical protein n=1 Tax=Roseovarius pacificus TaxID=337701 RepID=UPI002A186E4A|nr:hypothetical protein [Roseovarius pacificus]